jgi:hypothetical protein
MAIDNKIDSIAIGEILLIGDCAALPMNKIVG